MSVYISYKPCQQSLTNPIFYFPEVFLSQLMFGGIFRHLFGGAYAALLLLVILSTHHGCSARKNNSYCAPSCGNIHNISYPFRLNTDLESCGHKNYELVCENNVRPTLNLSIVKYYVQAINYGDFTIRIVEAGVQKDDCFSIPRHSIMPYISPSAYYDQLYTYHDQLYMYHDQLYNIGYQVLITFICCENQILHPPYYFLDTSSCKNGSSTAYNSSSSSSISSPSCIKEGHSYVIIGNNAHLQDLPDLCRINLIYSVPGFLLPENRTNMSYIDVHDVLVHGFELSWLSACCHSVKENRCNLDESTRNNYCRHGTYSLSLSLCLPQVLYCNYRYRICFILY